MMPLDKLGLIARGLSWLNPARYAFHLVLRSGDSLQYLNLFGEWQDRPVSGELYLMGLRAPGAEGLGMGAYTLMFVLAVQIVAQLAYAGYRLRRLPRKARRPNRGGGHG